MSRDAAIAASEPDDGALRVRLRRVVFWSVASGLAATVPVPFLDDHLVRLARRRMVGEQAQAHGIALTAAELHHLSGTERRVGLGCLVALLFSATFKIAVKLLRRIFRTLLFWLAIKDASDTASRTFHEGFLLALGLSGLKPPLEHTEADPVDPRLRDLRARIEGVTREIDTRPIERVLRSAFRSSKNVLRRAARMLARSQPGRTDEQQADELEAEVEAEEGLGLLISRVTSLLGSERAYFEDLARRFERAGRDPSADAARGAGAIPGSEDDTAPIPPLPPASA